MCTPEKCRTKYMSNRSFSKTLQTLQYVYCMNPTSSWNWGLTWYKLAECLSFNTINRILFKYLTHGKLYFPWPCRLVMESSYCREHWIVEDCCKHESFVTRQGKHQTWRRSCTEPVPFQDFWNYEGIN